MPYNSVIDRGNAPSTLLAGDVGALIPEEVSREVMQGVTEKSAALKLFRHRDMGTAQTRLPVLAALPTAYFVTGTNPDIGLKQTTEMSWTNVYLNAEEIATIVPIPEKILDDTKYDLWGEIKPWLEEAIAVALDDAIFFGTNKPATWATAIVTAAAAANNVVRSGTSSTIDFVDDINNVLAAVEADGYMPNGFFARMQLRAKLRGLRDTTKAFLFQPDDQSAMNMPLQFGTLFNEPIVFSRAGFSSFATAADQWSLITGDFTQGIIGVRQDISYKMLDQAVLTDAGGLVVYNLPQQDMVALRVVARFAFAVPNPINRLQPVGANRYPFGALQQKATTGGE
jgi:HK97 family phage major capsid protein